MHALNSLEIEWDNDIPVGVEGIRWFFRSSKPLSYNFLKAGSNYSQEQNGSDHRNFFNSTAQSFLIQVRVDFVGF